MLLIFLVCVLLPAVQPYDRYQKDYERNYAIDDSISYKPVTHTFPNRTQCKDLCEHECSVTHVYMSDIAREMFVCTKLKPPKVTIFASLKSNSFYMTLVVLALVVISILLLLTLCFCCSYCCRTHPASSRGSSKDALNPQDPDGEFREYLNNEENGILKREREFARRPRQAHVV